MKNKLYIGEAAQKLNISKRAILYYEDIGLIKGEREKGSNYRLYGKEEIIKLQQIILFKKVKLPLNEIYKIVTSKNSEYAVSSFKKQLKKVSSEISNLNYCKEILKSFINIASKIGSSNIDVIELLSDLTCVDSKGEKIIGLNKLYEISMEVHIGSDLIPIADINTDGSLIKKVKELRDELKFKMNISLPLIRIVDKRELDKDEYLIKLPDYVIVREKIKGNDKCITIINSLKSVICNNSQLFKGGNVSNDRVY